jgi:hypothetical protein
MLHPLLLPELRDPTTVPRSAELPGHPGSHAGQADDPVSA